MKKFAGLLLISFMMGDNAGLFAQPISNSEVKTYKNPLPVVFGDPYVLYVKGDMYYMYGTGGARNSFSAYSSVDLVNWKAEGQVWFANDKNGWTDSTAGWNGAYWAPEVYEVNGKFYMFYSCQWKDNPNNDLENFRIGVAVANKPT
ncbi:MAG: family 43 glycosylhydrolase, partial [Chitinophagaceae bacterium]